MEKARNNISSMISDNYAIPNVATPQPYYSSDRIYYNQINPVIQDRMMEDSVMQRYTPDYYPSNVNMMPTSNRPMGYCPNNYPMNFPMLPMYGYDNTKDLDKDMTYMKSLYPKTCKVIQHYIDDECDKLEYDGSCMFDEYPDKCHLGAIIVKIYDKVKASSDITIEVDSLDNGSVDKESDDKDNSVEAQQFFTFYGPRRNDWLNNLIEIMLFNEIFNRRRRHRRRRRWY